LTLHPQTPLGEEQMGLSGVAHTTLGPAVQIPLWQMSAWVQPSPSLQPEPSIFAG